MIMTANDREEARIKRLRDQMREQDRLRFANPDRDFELEAIWVIYLWDGEKWILAGFRPRRRRRKPQTMARFCAKVRRKLMIERGTPIKLMGLDRAARLARQNDTAWQFIPPERKPRRVRPDAPDPVFYGKKQPKRRAHDKAIRFHKRDSTFVVLGRNPWERAKGHLFLGPLTIETKRSAEREAARLFPIYNDLVVVATDALSKPLRNQMHSGKRIRAGVTRIVWPEVPPMFPVVWEKAIRKTPAMEFHRETVYLAWVAEGSPWLTRGWIKKQLKQFQEPEHTHCGGWPCTMSATKKGSKRSLGRTDAVLALRAKQGGTDR